MPVKFKAYNIFCYVLILFTSILFVYFAYELSRLDIAFTTPIWGLLILVLFFACYYITPILGIGFIKALNNNQDINRPRIILFRVIFFIQLVFQALIFYNSIETVQNTMRMLEIGFNSPWFYYEGVVLELIGTLIALLTLYLEVFSFSLISYVKRNHRSMLEELNNLGSI